MVDVTIEHSRHYINNGSRKFRKFLQEFLWRIPFQTTLISPAATIYHAGFKNNYLKLIKICTFAVDHWYLNIKSFRVRLAVKPKIITSLSVGTKSAQFIYSFLTLREKCPNTELFLIHIFPHSDWMGRDTSFSPYSVRMREHTDQK